jgi:hypothetical protein
METNPQLELAHNLLKIVQDCIHEYGYYVEEPVFVHEIKSKKKQKSDFGR